MREFKKGSLAMLVLHLLYERPSYGYELCERVRERSEGTLTFEDGAVYPLLHTLERDGLAEGYWEAEESEESASSVRKGPRRRYYRLTPRGVEALRAALQEWSTFSTAVERIVGDGVIVEGEGQR